MHYIIRGTNAARIENSPGFVGFGVGDSVSTFGEPRYPMMMPADERSQAEVGR